MNQHQYSSVTRVRRALSRLCAAALLSAMQPLSAAVLDQSWEFAERSNWASVGFASPPGALVRAQSFTSGLTGTLAAVDVLYLSREASVTEPLVIEVRRSLGGAPAETPLASLSVAPGDIAPNGTNEPTTDVYFDLSAWSIPVSAGEKLFIVLASDAVAGARDGYWWVENILQTSLYAGGEAWRKFGASAWDNEDDGSIWQHDFGFRSYVQPVPLPAALPLLGGALAMLFGRRGRRAVRWRRGPGWS